MFFEDAFWNKIYNEDTRNMIKNELNESYDLILSDPPYNIDYKNNRRIKTRENIHGVDGIKNDKDNLDMISEIYKEYFRILKPWKHIYIFTRWDVAQDHINLLKEAGFVIKNNLIWMKNSWSMGDLEGDYAWQYENILFWFKPFNNKVKDKKGEKLNPILWIKRHPNILKYDRITGKKQIHSHQKPIDLIKFLILKSTKQKDKIFDGFLGSNSLWLAAITLDRYYSGAEMDKIFFPTMKEYIEKYANTIKDFIDNVNNDYIYIPELYLLILNKTYNFKNNIIIKNKKEKITLNKKNLKDYVKIEYNDNFDFYFI